MLSFILKTCIDLIYPPYCMYCKELFDDRQQVLCAICISTIQPVVSYPLKVSDSCTVSVFSVGVYRDPLRRLIVSKQYRNRDAARALGALVWQLSDLKNTDFDYIVPVPLHWTRYAYRWYNQAEEMADIIAQKSGKPVVKILKRKNKTIVQAGLSKEERSKNLKYAFELHNIGVTHEYKNKTIVLVDDVMTTGSTIFSAIKTLRLLKPKAIIVAVACRVI